MPQALSGRAALTTIRESWSEFSWTPARSQKGEHLIAFAVDDGLMPEKMQIKIIVEDERENHEETHRLFPAPGAAGSHDRK